MPSLNLSYEAKHSLEHGLQRNEVFDVIPEGSSRILDIGYGDGCLLLRLMTQKNCTDCCGIEVLEREWLTPYLTENWQFDLFKQDLPEKYLGYFNWVVLHDVLEHVYDPWAFLGIVNQYVAPGGKVVIVCPNAQYWEVPYALLTGNWPLGVHGFWNEDHIRWFTFKSLCEVAIMAGFSVGDAYLQYPESLMRHIDDFQAFMSRRDNRAMELPPLGFNGWHLEDGLPFVSPTMNRKEPIKLLLDMSTQEMFPYLMAIKIMLVCEKCGDPTPFELKPKQMTPQRKQFYDQLGQKELQARIPKAVKIQFIR